MLDLGSWDEPCGNGLHLARFAGRGEWSMPNWLARPEIVAMGVVTVVFNHDRLRA
jgi:hypothetical protein